MAKKAITLTLDRELYIKAVKHAKDNYIKLSQLITSLLVEKLKGGKN